MKLFVGLDVSSEKLDTCFLTDDDDLSILLEKTFPNDLNGATAIKDQIIKFTESMIFQKIVIGMESTSLYSFHPATFFKRIKNSISMNWLSQWKTPLKSNNSLEFLMRIKRIVSTRFVSLIIYVFNGILLRH